MLIFSLFIENFPCFEIFLIVSLKGKGCPQLLIFFNEMVKEVAKGWTKSEQYDI